VQISCDDAATVGALRYFKTGSIFSLPTPTVVGRGPDCAVRLSDACVSNQHAELVWERDSWILRDLDSTNGTWLNGKLIEQARYEHRLSPGDRIAFGAETDEWQLEDDSGPQVMVIPSEGGKGIPMRRGVIRFSKELDGAVPRIIRGDGAEWRLEVGSSVMVISPGSVIHANGRAWRFCCPAAWRPTAKVQPVRSLREAQLVLRVPRNMEKIELTAHHAQEQISLGRSSIFLLLVVLAERRKTEQEAGSKDAGWVGMEDLESAFKTRETHINVWVHRIRGRFANQGFLDSGAIIQRRDGTRQIRVGTANAVIEYLT
jgi:hypothetical protein